MSRQLHHMRLMARMATSPLEDRVSHNESQIQPLTED